MSFSTLFSLHTALGMAVGYAWFLLPGLLAQRWVAGSSESRARLLFAPLLGMATFGPVSVLVFNLAPYHRLSLVASYLLFNGALLRLGRKGTAGVARDAVLLQLACAALALIPCVSIYPFVHDGALYTGSAIHDHARVVFIDAIHRHGLPPINPIFAPGQDVVFNYYYLWLFLAAQLRTLLGIPGWPADVALSWLTFLAVTSAGAGIALELGRTRAAAWAVLLLAASGPLTAALPWLGRLGLRAPLAPVVEQAAWAPHHLLATAAIVLALYLFAAAAEGGEACGRTALILGCLLGCVFGCSIWLAFGLVVSAPFLLLALVFCYRHQQSGLDAAAVLVAKTSGVALLLCLPVLICAIAGPFAYQGTPVRFELYRVLPRTASAWTQFGLFWVYAVPLAYGASAPLGIAGVLGGMRRGPSQLFAALSLAAISGFLLVTQLIRSVVMNNDLGWRAHTVAHLTLIVWAALSIDALRGRTRVADKLAQLTVAVVVACGVFAAPVTLPRPAPSESASVRDDRTRFLLQPRAWAIVRRHAGPDDFVQANPYAFNALSPWPIDLGYMLFADRRSVFAHPNWVRTYAHGLGDDLIARFHRIVTNAFSRAPDPRLLQSLRDGFRVKVLLVGPADGVWSSDALERSAIYRRVHGEPAFRVYLAANR